MYKKKKRKKRLSKYFAVFISTYLFLNVQSCVTCEVRVIGLTIQFYFVNRILYCHRFTFSFRFIRSDILYHLHYELFELRQHIDQYHYTHSLFASSMHLFVAASKTTRKQTTRKQTTREQTWEKMITFQQKNSKRLSCCRDNIIEFISSHSSVVRKSLTVRINCKLTVCFCVKI